MKLIEQIRVDRMLSFRAKMNIKKNILGCLISESCKIDKEPNDDHVLAVIKKFIDGAKEIQEVSEVGSYDFFQATQEIDILESYRPEQLTEDEIRKLCKGCYERYHDLPLKSIMQYFKDHYPNRYDGKLVSSIAKEMVQA